MKKNRTELMMSAAVAGIFAASMAVSSQAFAHGGKGKKVDCMGVNSCKGQSACKGANGCKGKNDCKGQGMMKMSEKECKEKGGTMATGKEMKQEAPAKPAEGGSEEHKS